jgi:hypothetical protein
MIMNAKEQNKLNTKIIYLNKNVKNCNLFSGVSE